jgi:uncharacterized membrane protein
MWRRIAPAERDATAPGASSSPSRAAWRGVIAVGVLLAPVAGWLVRYAGWPHVGDALAAVTILAALAALVRTLGVPGALVAAIGTAGCVAVALTAGIPAVYGPPIAINFAIAALFAASLWRGEPLVTRFARLQRHAMTPEAERYTRKLTVVWACYLCALGVAGILIALHGNERWGAWWSGLLDYMLIAALFAGELVYRHRSVRGFVAQLRSVRAAMRGPT